MVVLGACRRDSEPWSEDDPKQEVAVVVRTGSSVGAFSPVNYQLFVYDEQKQETDFCEVPPEAGDARRFRWKLSPGTYTGFCMVNVVNQTVLEYSKSKTPEQIFVKLEKNAGNYTEAADYLLGQADFTVTEGEPVPVVFDMQRKVAQLRVIVENVPENLTDLTIHVFSIPLKMNLLGNYTSETGTLIKTAGISVAGISTTGILLFPPVGESGLMLSYRVGNTPYQTPVRSIQTLTANRITEIKAVFGSIPGSEWVGFETEIYDWEETIVRERDWYIDIPPDVCKGVGNGVNLIQNGDFEGGVTEGIPEHWKLDANGTDKKSVVVDAPVYQGNKAVRLEGKTYLYQDVPVSEGRCYQLRMYVRADVAEVKWRVWCTWMAGNRSLASEEIRSSAYGYQTEGYVDVFRNGIFRAPAGTTKLRMEVRTYMSSWTGGTGLYVDTVAAELVE